MSRPRYGAAIIVGLSAWLCVGAAAAASASAGPARPGSVPARPARQSSARQSSARQSSARAGSAPARGPGAICAAPSDRLLAARLSSGIAAALRGRVSSVGLAVADPADGITCGLAADRRYDSASVVKATILAALLQDRTEDGQELTGAEDGLAREMITESDNDAASALWHDVGPEGVARFLALARMTETSLDPGGAWGLTLVTARDQVRLLRLLAAPNRILGARARGYELGLMAEVEPGQRWGVSAGAPAWMTVHLKNGWLPRAVAGWRINSIGYLTGRRKAYFIAVLSDDNPTMAYGVQTISGVATVINRLLTAALPAALPRTARAAGPWRSRVPLTRKADLKSLVRARVTAAKPPPRRLAVRLAMLGAGCVAVLGVVALPSLVLLRRRRAQRSESTAVSVKP